MVDGLCCSGAAPAVDPVPSSEVLVEAVHSGDTAPSMAPPTEDTLVPHSEQARGGDAPASEPPSATIPFISTHQVAAIKLDEPPDGGASNGWSIAPNVVDGSDSGSQRWSVGRMPGVGLQDCRWYCQMRERKWRSLMIRAVLSAVRSMLSAQTFLCGARDLWNPPTPLIMHGSYQICYRLIILSYCDR